MNHDPWTEEREVAAGSEQTTAATPWNGSELSGAEKAFVPKRFLSLDVGMVGWLVDSSNSGGRNKGYLSWIVFS